MDNSRLGTLRTVSSDPRGVMATVDEQLSSWAVDQREPDPQWSEGPENGVELGIHPRMGIGLPMSNIFATYVHRLAGCVFCIDIAQILRRFLGAHIPGWMG